MTGWQIALFIVAIPLAPIVLMLALAIGFRFLDWVFKRGTPLGRLLDWLLR